jgi:hypothetical protein
LRPRAYLAAEALPVVSIRHLEAPVRWDARCPSFIRVKRQIRMRQIEEILPEAIRPVHARCAPATIFIAASGGALRTKRRNRSAAIQETGRRPGPRFDGGRGAAQPGRPRPDRHAVLFQPVSFCNARRPLTSSPSRTLLSSVIRERFGFARAFARHTAQRFSAILLRLAPGDEAPPISFATNIFRCWLTPLGSRLLIYGVISEILGILLIRKSRFGEGSKL